MKAPTPDPNRSERLGDDAPALPSERPAGDELLGVEEVRALFPPNAVTQWWLRRNFAPEDRIPLGRRVYWWRSDAVRWINSQKRGRD